MSEKRKWTSPSEMHVKNQGKKINIEDKLDIISRLEEGEQNV